MMFSQILGFALRCCYCDTTWTIGIYINVPDVGAARVLFMSGILFHVTSECFPQLIDLIL